MSRSSEVVSGDTSTIAMRADGLTVTFGGLKVLYELDLSVAKGERLAIIGANGAGKTTLLRCLSGLQRPGSGSIEWYGRQVSSDPEARRVVGFAGHQRQCYSELSARENLVFAGRMWNIRNLHQRVENLLHTSELLSAADRPAGELSHGMRQRLSVARSLIHDPAILLLDEPYSGLDAAGKSWLTRVLDELRNNSTTVCLTTHDIPLAERLADRVLVLHEGSLAMHRSAIPQGAAAA